MNTVITGQDDAEVLEQFCGKLGLRVPKDLSIVSFNNSLFSRITSPQLTTVDVNPYQLGMEAASQTISRTRIFWQPRSSCRISSSNGRAAARRRRSDVQKTRPFPLFSREAERPRFAYFFRYSRGVMPKCALNARLK